MSGRRKIRFGMIAAAAVLSVANLACGPAEDKLIPVEGRITYDGKPLIKGSVIFHPDAGKNNQTTHLPHGAIDSQGRYKMTTHPRTGAPAGWYKVAVVVAEPSDPKNPYSPPRSLIPENFARADESGLALEVRPGAAPGSYDLELK
jgi:hypothetical protein